jgi:hypothetical protein
MLARHLAEALSAHIHTFLDAVHWFSPLGCKPNSQPRRCFCEPEAEVPQHAEETCKQESDSFGGGPETSEGLVLSQKDPAAATCNGTCKDDRDCTSQATAVLPKNLGSLSADQFPEKVPAAAAHPAPDLGSQGKGSQTLDASRDVGSQKKEPDTKGSNGQRSRRRSSFDVLSPFMKPWWVSTEGVSLTEEGPQDGRGHHGPKTSFELLSGDGDPKKAMRRAALTRKYSLDASGTRFADESVEAEFRLEMGNASFMVGLTPRSPL